MSVQHQWIRPPQERSDLRVSCTTRADATVVELRGGLDAIGAAVLRAELDRVAGARRRLVLVMAGVDLIDSAGIGMLVDARRALQNDFCVLAIQEPSPVVRRALEIGGLIAHFEVVDT
jgi:anti-anti-sigma factor